jgi:hypothetical protein
VKLGQVLGISPQGDVTDRFFPPFGYNDPPLARTERVDLQSTRPALDVEPEGREKDLRLPEIRHRETKVVERMDASTTLGFCGIFGRGAQA